MYRNVDKEHVLLYTEIVETQKVPAIGLGIKIDQDMSFTVHLKEVSIDTSSFNWLSNSGKIERWSHVENLLSMQIIQRFRRAPTVDYYMTMAHDNLVEAIPC